MVDVTHTIESEDENGKWMNHSQAHRLEINNGKPFRVIRSEGKILGPVYKICAVSNLKGITHKLP